MQNSIQANLLIFLLFLQTITYSQNKNPPDTTSKIILCESILSYPLKAQDNNIFGTVVVLFDLDSNCRIINIRIDKGIGYGCDEAAIHALKKCHPKFINGKGKCTQTSNLRQAFTFTKPEDD
jgi:TonB family protein